MKCDNCGTDEEDQAIVSHDKEHWCLDCMREANHCISCDVYLPNVVVDLFNYEDDECPSCVNADLNYDPYTRYPEFEP